MELEEAKEVLKIEKGVADLDISNNQHNQNTINFSEAVEVVLAELDKLSQRQKLIEKLDEDILEDGYMREEQVNKRFYRRMINNEAIRIIEEMEGKL
jgi:hypothetical protein